MRYLTKWLILLLPVFSVAQTPLQLEAVYEKAREHYPLLQQKKLVQQTAALSIENLTKGMLPQISINGQASYQSEVTAIAISFPGVTINPLSKDQYRLTADISQLIYDGGLNKQQQALQELNAGIEEQKLEVELYKLRERITQVFLSILYIDAQLKQADLLAADIETGMHKVEAQIANGTAFKSGYNALKAERLKTGQRMIELKATRRGLLSVLGLFMQETLADDQPLQQPSLTTLSDTTITRPEITLFQQQQKFIKGQSALIDIRNKPKASAFLQAGYGRPGLNMLKNSFEPFGIGGIRFSWSLSGWYTAAKEKKLAGIQQQTVQLQQETFLLQTRTQVTQQEAEISKLKELIAADDEIIALRVSVKQAAAAQLENGVITAGDYLREVNAEDQARQQLNTHKIQLIQAQANLRLIAGHS
jgi:outer membrane protein TolC